VPQYWVEISALAHGHGGAGWELGVCLWSPAADRRDSKRYEIMREPAPGDVIYHLITVEGGRALVGVSEVSESVQRVLDPPPEPGVWANFSAYYRIPLQKFSKLAYQPMLREIEDDNLDGIRQDIFPNRPKHHPYATYGAGVRIAQGLRRGAVDDDGTGLGVDHGHGCPLQSCLAVTNERRGTRGRARRWRPRATSTPPCSCGGFC